MKNSYKRIKKVAFVSIMLAVLAIPVVSFTNSSTYFEISKNLDIFATLYKELNTYYVDQVEPSDLMREGIDGMLESLDPYTNYISEADIEGYRLQTTGKYGGIGSLIRTINKEIIVAEPYEGYAADKAGLKAGDIIVTIDGEAAYGKTTEEISKLLKGQANTTVNVTLKRLQADSSFKTMDVVITREEIKIKNVPYYGMVDNEVGYIRLSNFTENAGKEVRDALEALKTENPNLQGIILDLRGNPGGLLNEAVNVSNVFIDKGQDIVYTKGKVQEWDKTFKTLNPSVDTEMPLVVLTNRSSASASEIVSGSIQDLDRGVIVGQKSFGKGLVQTTRNLSYNTKLKVTTAKYYIPSGRCIQSINYAEKNEDGSVSKVADSLKTAFKTKCGRIVYDGGGIDPDVFIDPQTLSKISISLLQNNLIFHYATLYTAKHPTIADPKKFQFSEADYQDFISYLKNKDYDYTTKSEELLKDLEDAVEKENYKDAVASELEKLEASIKHDKDKDLIKHKKQIMELLEEEIVSRYYYTSGKIASSFEHDPDVTEAVSVLKDKTRYKELLSVQN